MDDNKNTDTFGVPLEELFARYKTEMEAIQAKLESSEKYQEIKVVLQREDTDQMLLRYIIGKQGDVDKAWQQFEKSVELRIKYQTHNAPDYDDPKLEEFLKYSKKVIPNFARYFFRGTTKDGHLLGYDFRGSIDALGMQRDVTLEEFEHYAAIFSIVNFRYICKCSREAGKLLGVFIVTDFARASGTTFKYIPYLKKEIEFGELNNPECNYKGVVVNAPWIFNMAWAVVSPMMDKRTSEKVGVCSTADLEKYIDRKNIPTILGGDDPAPGLKLPDPARGLVKVNVKPGAKHVVVLRTDKPNTVVSWKWMLSSLDIGFSVHFKGEEDEEAELVEEYQRVSAQNKIFEGSFRADRIGQVIVTWDNSYSIMTAKDIVQSVSDVQMDEITSQA